MRRRAPPPVWHMTCSTEIEPLRVGAQSEIFVHREDLAMYEPQYDEETGGGGFVFGLLCGAALGAAVGLMFAPKAGSELRRTLYDSTGDIRKKATDAYGQATQTVNDYVSKGKDAVDRGRQAF